MKHVLSFVFLSMISVGVPTGAAAETPGEFVKQVVIGINGHDLALESRVLEAKLLAAYKRALEINEKKNCEETPSLGGYVNGQDGPDFVSVKTIAAGAKSAQVRVGSVLVQSSNDSIFYLQSVGGAWKVYDVKGVKESAGFRSWYLNWRCPTIH